MKRKLFITVIIAVLFGAVIVTARHINHLNDGIKLKQIELKDNSVKLELLDKQYDELNSELQKKDSDKQELQKKLDELQKERESLSRELQAKKEQKERDIAAAAQKAVKQAVVPSKAYALSGNAAKDFIYQKESGNRTDAINRSSGACGLGQALPCSKLPCSLQDYACQDAWFTNYAMKRYGSWEAAMAFWKKNSWW